MEFELNRRGMKSNAAQANTGDKANVRSVSQQDTIAGPARILNAQEPQQMIRQISQALAEFDAETESEKSLATAAASKSQAPCDQEVVELLLRNAGILAAAKEHRLALNILRNILIRSPEHPAALRMMGVSLRDSGRLDEALKCFRALSKATRSIDAQILMAEAYYLSERDDMALAAYREALKSVISNPDQQFEVFKNIGNIHVRAGDFEAAEEFYNKAYVLRPDSDVLMVNYGTLEITRENLGAAVERFRKAVEINPENDKGWVGLAMVHRLMGDHALAKANLERALDTNKSNRTALRLIVEWSVEEMNFGSAIRRLQDYISTDGGEDAEMCFTLAKIFTQMGRVNEARLEMERVLALDPFIEAGEAIAKALDQEIALRNQPTENRESV